MPPKAEEESNNKPIMDNTTAATTIAGAPPAMVSPTNNAGTCSTNASSGCYLRWSRLEKSVEVSSTQAGLMGRSSIAGVVSNNKPDKSSRSIQADKSESNKNGNAKSERSFSLHRSLSLKSTGVGRRKSSAAGGVRRKHILHGVSGHAAPGEMLALMGPSGSGKTSLLNVLSGRSVYQDGVISINGQAVASQASMKRFMSKLAYVKQNDIFFGHLTVRDQLTYTALLRMPRAKKNGKGSEDSQQQQQQNDINAEVNRILRLLRLNKVADSPIMLVSGGERKRVNIGTELLTDPTVVLLDEPTSGLDSTSAVSLLKLLQDSLAVEQGKTVICSIHQPSSAMFRSFDQLLMLSEGHVVYFGKPVDSLDYLRTQNLACPDGYNAADHWMDLLVATDDGVDEDQGDESEKQQQQADGQASNGNDEEEALVPAPRFHLQKAWDGDAVAELEDCGVTMQSSEHSRHSKRDSVHQQVETDLLTEGNSNKYNTNWWTQFTVLIHRALKNSRSAIFTTLNFVKSVALGLTAGVVWFRTTYTEANVHNIRSFLFYAFTYWMFDSMFGALTAFPTERQVILKERASGSYHLSAYFMAKTAADVPVRLILPTLFMISSYWLAGIDYRFVIFLASLGCVLLSSVAGEAIGLMLGAAMSNLENAMTTMTVVTLALMLLGGFFVENLPFWLSWAKYISPFKYVFDSALQVLFYRPVPCDDSGALADLCAGGVGTSASPRDVLDSFGVQGTIGFNLGILVLIALIPRYLAYLALRMQKDGERS